MIFPAFTPWDPRRVELEHLLSLHRYGNGLRGKVDQVIRNAFADVNSLLVRDYLSLTAFQRRRALALYGRLGQMLQEKYGDLGGLVEGELTNLAALEGTFTEQTLQQAVAGTKVEIGTTAFTDAQLKAIARFPVQGSPLSDWWAEQSRATAFRLRSQIQIGLLQGEGIPQIVRRVGVIDANGITTGVLRQARVQASAIVRTAVTSVSTQAAFETLSSQDPTVTSKYQFVATLDDRTTPICQSLDGQVFDYDDSSAPKPPLHVGCRSTIVPVLDWEALGLTNPESIVPLTRASMTDPRTPGTMELGSRSSRWASRTTFWAYQRASCSDLGMPH
jgi:SPP1 gp7 family putative phage head morphogenesis protein